MKATFLFLLSLALLQVCNGAVREFYLVVGWKAGSLFILLCFFNISHVSIAGSPDGLEPTERPMLCANGTVPGPLINVTEGITRCFLQSFIPFILPAVNNETCRR
jgi:hypothetical protein